MFIGFTLMSHDKDGNPNEIRVVFSSDDIKALVENKEKPDTCMLMFKGEKDSNVLVKGSYDNLSKLLYSFNKK